VSHNTGDDALYVIRTFSNDMDASLAEAVLEANGIPSTRISDDAGGMMPWLHSLHPIRLMVRGADVDLALSLLDGESPTETAEE
jgi:putative signal transducing protein